MKIPIDVYSSWGEGSTWPLSVGVKSPQHLRYFFAEGTNWLPVKFLHWVWEFGEKCLIGPHFYTGCNLPTLAHLCKEEHLKPHTRLREHQPLFPEMEVVCGAGGGPRLRPWVLRFSSCQQPPTQSSEEQLGSTGGDRAG